MTRVIRGMTGLLLVATVAACNNDPGVDLSGDPTQIQATPQVMIINQGATVHVQGAATPEQAAQAIRQAEMALGMDLDGDGVVGGTGPGAGAAAMAGTPFAPPPAGSGGGDVVSQLERLAALHRSGALTDQEFAAQKARLLGG